MISENTSPDFIVRASDDKAVPVNNSLITFERLVKNNAPAEIHVFQKRVHGLERWKIPYKEMSLELYLFCNPYFHIFIKA